MHKENTSLGYLLIVLGLAVFGIFNFSVIAQVQGKIATSYYQNKEILRPANLEITILKNNCPDCRDIGPMVESIKQQNTKIVKKDIDAESNEGKELIKKYNIKKLPAILVSGELNRNPELKKIWNKLGDINETTFVLREVNLPYWSVDENKVRGEANLIFLVDKTCAECYDVSQQKNILNNYGLSAKTEKTLDISSPEGAALARKYGIRALPVFVLEGDLAPYAALSEVWKSVGKIDGGAYVFGESGLKLMGVIYKDIWTKKIIKPAVPVSSGGADSAHNHG